MDGCMLHEQMPHSDVLDPLRKSLFLFFVLFIFLRLKKKKKERKEKKKIFQTLHYYIKTCLGSTAPFYVWWPLSCFKVTSVSEM